MSYAENGLLRLVDEQGGARILRVLRVSNEQDVLLAFDVEADDSYPEVLVTSELVELHERGMLTVLETDIWAPGYVPTEVEIRAMETTRRGMWEKRLEACDHRARLVVGLQSCPVDRLTSGRAVRAYVREVSIQEHCSRHTVLAAWRTYWRGGQKEGALMPKFENRGGAGKERVSREGDIKRGRKPEHLDERPERIGINVTQNIKQKLQRGYAMFYVNSGLRFSLREAYSRTCDLFFIQGISRDEMGRVHPILLPPHETPTYGQFLYWGDKYHRARRRANLIKRHGKRKFDMVYRPMSGTFTRNMKGPGWIYQTDSWEAEVSLRARDDRSVLIGKPIVHLMRCTFSHLITGFHVTLEPKNYYSAALALENAASDKAAFCERYGRKGMYWPARHLPRQVLADWGEFGGEMPSHWVKSLDVRVGQTPPYRPNLKPLIETTWAQLYSYAVQQLEGADLRNLGAGERDPRLDGIFTLDHFTEILLGVVDMLNNLEMEDYDLSAEMLADGLKNPSPMDLWEWGEANCASGLRTIDPTILKLHLLPGKVATITPFGMDIDGALYTCERAQREEWGIRAQERRVKKGNKGSPLSINVAVDPRNMSLVSVREDGQTKLEPCQLVKPLAFANRPWAEYETWRRSKRLDKLDGEAERRQIAANRRADVQHLTVIAKSEASFDQRGKSKKQLVTPNLKHRRQEQIERGIEETMINHQAATAASSSPHLIRGTPAYIGPARYTQKKSEKERS